MEVNKQRIAELVVKIQNGDKSAFDELYKQTSERAYFVALEFTKNNQDAEDILQESYIKALSKISELDKPESFSSWLNQIVANKSKDFLKKKKPMLFNSDEEETDTTELLPDEYTSFSPEENLDQTELQKTVMEVLDELSEEKRACVLMMYFEELSVGEIAETLEIPEGTVKTRLFSARKDLKDKFAKRGITSLYSTAPIGVVIWALRRLSGSVSKTFVGSGTSAKVLAGITVAGTSTAAGVAVAGTTAATGTGVAAKIAALTVAQKVVAGVSVAAVVAGGTVGVVTVANNDDKKDGITTTAYTEEYTTAPSFETTLAVDALGTVEFSETNSSTLKNSTTAYQNTTNKTTEKATTSSKPTTTKKQTTTRKSTTSTKKQTAASTKATATQKPATTKKETTAVETEAKNETTTKKVTTTKAATTEKQTTTTKPTTTTTKPTTTEATTKGTATVIINVLDLDNTVIDTLTYTVEAGTEMTSSYLWGLVETDGYSISGVFGSDKGSVAQAGKTYSFEAEI